MGYFAGLRGGNPPGAFSRVVSLSMVPSDHVPGLVWVLWGSCASTGGALA